MQILISAAVGTAIGLLSLGFYLSLGDTTSQLGWSTLARMARWNDWLSAIPVPRWLEQRWRSVELKLIHAGLPFTPRAFMGLRWGLLCTALAATGVFLLSGVTSFLRIFLALALLLFSWWGPSLWLRWRSESRLRQLNYRLPDFMDRLKLGLDAGLGFEWALRRSVRNQRGLLEMELKRMLAMLDRGHTKAQAFDQFVQRNPSEDLRSFAAAVKQAERLGSPLTKSLEVQGRLLRARRRRRAQQASRRLPVLIVFPLVFFFLPALLIIYLGPPLLHLFLGQ
jgi:Flp pilus assembly protein TadB